MPRAVVAMCAKRQVYVSIIVIYSDTVHLPEGAEGDLTARTPVAGSRYRSTYNDGTVRLLCSRNDVQCMQALHINSILQSL